MMLPGVYDYFQGMFQDCADLWVVSDTHFGDEELRVGIPQRPIDDELVKRINAKCGKQSALIHLGDVGDLTYVKKLRAKVKVLIMGNHDKSAESYKRKTVTRVFDQDIFSKEQAIAAAKVEYPDYDVVSALAGHQLHAPFTYWYIIMDNKLFDFVFTGPILLGEKLMLSHEPLMGIDWAVNVHGHDHAGRMTGPGRKNVCLDVTGYEPFHLQAALKTGLLANTKTVHRQTIDKATEKKRKRAKR